MLLKLQEEGGWRHLWLSNPVLNDRCFLILSPHPATLQGRVGVSVFMGTEVRTQRSGSDPGHDKGKITVDTSSRIMFYVTTHMYEGWSLSPRQ